MTKIRGIRFEPETPSGGSWLLNYPTERYSVVTQLNQLKEKTSASHIAVTLAANYQLAFPQPTANEISRLNTFLADAQSEGFKVVLVIGSPTVTSNEEVLAAGGPGVHVGGRQAGEVVNGRTLFWNPPYAGPNRIQEASSFYTSIACSLNPLSAFESLIVSGDHRAAFSTETNLFYSESPHRASVANYLRSVIEAIHAESLGIKVGVELISSHWKTGSAVYEQAAYVAANVTNADVYEHTVQWPVVDVKTLAGYLPAGKLVLTDFKLRTPALPSQYVGLMHFISEFYLYNCLGYWVWEYIDRGAGGFRLPASQGGAWNEKMCSVIKTDSTG